MPALTYNISNNDLNKWATEELIAANLIYDAVKRLNIAIDALTNSAVVNPEQSYEITNS
jgi:hypothetical protein